MNFAFKSMVLVILVVTPAISRAEDQTSEKKKSSPDTDSTETRSILFLGVGLSYLLDDVEDFRTLTRGDSVLTIEMDSKFRPSIITGIMYSFDRRARYNVLVSAKFDPSNDDLLDGFLIGFAWRFNKTVALALSYDLRLGSELNGRFRREAASLVKYVKDHPDYSERFSGYQVNENGNDLIDTEQYDGFPLYDPRNNRMLGGGHDPFRRSFNSAFHLGIIFARTINLKDHFPAD